MTASHVLHRPASFIAVCVSLACALALVAALAVWVIIGGATASALSSLTRSANTVAVGAGGPAAP